jgi:lipoprotein NlpI
MASKWLASMRSCLASLQPKPYDSFPGYKKRIAYDDVCRGNLLLQDKQYDAAIWAYSHAIEFQPDLAEAFCNRSGAFLGKSDYDLALQDCNHAISINPHLAYAFCNRGTAYLGRGECKSAIQEYEQSIKLKPDFALAFNNRGFAFLVMGNLDRALMDYDQAIDLKPDLALAFRNRAAAAFCRRRFTEARRDCVEAVRLDPTDGDNVIWQYVASARDRRIDQDELKAQTAGLDLSKWPGPVIGFLIGSLTREALLLACRDGHLCRQREQTCAAQFFIGQQEFLEGKALEAANSFRKATESGAIACLEHLAAEAELLAERT